MPKGKGSKSSADRERTVKSMRRKPETPSDTLETLTLPARPMAFTLQPLYNAANCDDNEGEGISSRKKERRGEEIGGRRKRGRFLGPGVPGTSTLTEANLRQVKFRGGGGFFDVALLS